MSLAEELAALFRRDLTRLAQQVQAFPDDQILWQRSGTMNPAGNLVLHLEGNLREYIGRQLGNVAYQRERPQEFSLTGVSRDSLSERVEEIRDLVSTAILSLSDSQLDATYPENALGGPLSTRQFLIHLHGHLNYHLGQIDYLRRILTDGSAVNYAGL